MGLGNVVDELHDEHRLADASAPEKANLATTLVRRQQVHHLHSAVSRYCPSTAVQVQYTSGEASEFEEVSHIFLPVLSETISAISESDSTRPTGKGQAHTLLATLMQHPSLAVPPRKTVSMLWQSA